jgi:hypothetical protein
MIDRSALGLSFTFPSPSSFSEGELALVVAMAQIIINIFIFIFSNFSSFPLLTFFSPLQLLMVPQKGLRVFGDWVAVHRGKACGTGRFRAGGVFGSVGGGK